MWDHIIGLILIIISITAFVLGFCIGPRDAYGFTEGDSDSSAPDSDRDA